MSGRERKPNRIVKGLDEALRWMRGEGTMLVTMPGQPPREMTHDEFLQEQSSRFEKIEPVPPSRSPAAR